MVDDIVKKGAKKLELIIMDEHNTRMQAGVRSGLVNKFKHKLEEGKAVTLQLYSLLEIQPRYRMLNKALRLSILHNTEIEACDDFTGSMYGFDFRSYRSITDLKHEEVGQFDIIGHVVACEDLDTYDKNGKPGKKKPLTLVDADGNELKCTLWSAFAQQFSDFLGTCSDHSKIVVVLHLAMMKMWDGHMCVQNAFNATKLFTFDCTQPILDETFIDVKEYSQRLFANPDVSLSDNTASRISTASKNSTKENFVSRIPPKNIAELLDVDQGVNSIIVGTIIAINEEEGWWYIGCKGCKKKVIRSSDMVDLEVDMPKKKTDVKEDWFCTKCNAVPNIKTMFRIQVRVHDETGSVSLTLWNDEIQPAIGSSAYHLCEKYGKVIKDGQTSEPSNNNKRNVKDIPIIDLSDEEVSIPPTRKRGRLVKSGSSVKNNVCHILSSDEETEVPADTKTHAIETAIELDDEEPITFSRSKKTRGSTSKAHSFKLIDEDTMMILSITPLLLKVTSMIIRISWMKM